jgi:protein-S-isoprenylcysteine O-methyltransferase Ste14
MQGTSGAPTFAARACAWGGTLLFVASLSYFLFSYAVTFGETASVSASAGRSLAIDVLLFTAFAVHHSVFARLRVRTWIAHVVPAVLERSVYVWVASALFIAVCAWWQPVAGVAWSVAGPTRWLLVGAQAAGVWLILRSAAMIDILELSGVRQLSPPSHTAPVFKTSGPYGWIRHPIYAGWFLLVFCPPLMTMTRLVFAVVSCAYLLIAIPLEERTLVAGTGDAYPAYQRQVRWRLVPGLY